MERAKKYVKHKPALTIERLLERTLPNGECLLFTGTIWSKRGYGGVRLNGRTVGAHRAAYILAYGETPAKGLNVCHKCDNKICINPEHLFLGTQQDNIKDMYAKGRGKTTKRNRKAMANAEEILSALERLCLWTESCDLAPLEYLEAKELIKKLKTQK